MPTIAISNQKGGVGKTTLTVHLAAYLATQGLRVLVADADPQANATAWLCGGERHQSAFWRLLIAREKVENVLVTGKWGVGLLPGSDETGDAFITLAALHRPFDAIAQMLTLCLLRWRLCQRPTVVGRPRPALHSAAGYPFRRSPGPLSGGSPAQALIDKSQS